MSTPSGPWSLAGLTAGAAGLAGGYLTATLLGIRESPVVAAAEAVVQLTPGAVAETLIGLVGRADKPLLVTGVVLVVGLVAAGIGRLARRTWPGAVLALTALAGLGAACVLTRPGSTLTSIVPVLVGLVVQVAVLSTLTNLLREAERAHDAGADDESATVVRTRRGFLVGVGVVVAFSAIGTAGARIAGRTRRAVERSRGLLRLQGITAPTVPASVRAVDVAGSTPWMTPVADFYRIDTAISTPAIEPSQWRLRIHGMVDREIEVGYDDLLARETTEDWITLNCVSNVVGGNLIGNAWFSGVSLAALLEEAGLDPEADALLQTSEDGWTCGTPISAVTDGRKAMLAVAMDGKPLPIEHGFPVRTVVPGLYGYVSATKWLVDIEVTRFADFSAYWTQRGWGEMGPVKIASRIDVPRSGAGVRAGRVDVGGVAWHQHTGIEGVEVAVDGGPWTAAEIAPVPGEDCWVPWSTSVDLDVGRHVLRVRATGKDGQTQTGVEADVLPDGATGWHTIEVDAG